MNIYIPNIISYIIIALIAIIIYLWLAAKNIEGAPSIIILILSAIGGFCFGYFLCNDIWAAILFTLLFAALWRYRLMVLLLINGGRGLR